MSGYGHPLLDEIEHRRRLLRSLTFLRTGSATAEAEVKVRASFRPDEIPLLMRAEVDHRRWLSLLRAIRKTDDPGDSGNDPLFEGPMTWHGISIYVVNRLRDPGWRLIGLVP